MDWAILIILLLSVLLVLYHIIKPRIDILQVSAHKYQILLWYNTADNTRKWIKIITVKTRKS